MATLNKKAVRIISDEQASPFVIFNILRLSSRLDALESLLSKEDRKKVDELARQHYRRRLDRIPSALASRIDSWNGKPDVVPAKGCRKFVFD